jgi:hypothetical protein
VRSCFPTRDADEGLGTSERDGCNVDGGLLREIGMRDTVMRKAFDRLRDLPFNEQVTDAMIIFGIVSIALCTMMLVLKGQIEYRRASQPGVEIHSTER